MASRSLALSIISAKDLKDVNIITKMDVYAVVSIEGESTQKKHKAKTPVDRSGGSNPTWNHTVKFSVNNPLYHDNHLTLVVKLKCDRVLGDKDIGEVSIPVRELLESNPPSPSPASKDNGMKFVTYQVRTPSGKAKGSLSFSYRFDDSVSETGPVKSDLPVSSYPVPEKSDLPTTTYPPPPGADGYTHAPPQPYGYTPPPQPYGYPPPPPANPVSPYPDPEKKYQPATAYPDPEKKDQPAMAYPAPLAGPSCAQPPVGSGYAYAPAPQHYGYPPPPPGESGYAYQQTPQPPSYGYAPPPTYGYAPPPTNGYAPPPTNGYAPPPQPGYGYPPPPQPGYGYWYAPPPVQQQPPKKNKFGLGLGAGLLGGAVGGLLIGDMVSDAAYDAGGLDF